MLSGIAALDIAFFATGGIIAALGFGLLGVLWLYTTVNVYLSIKTRDIPTQQKSMIRSYSLYIAAATLRIYLPSFIGLGGMEFISAYMIIAWLCWVPNLLVAEFLIIRNLPNSRIQRRTL